ncbi:MAG: ATP-binding protein [Pelobium sp.]
MILIVDDKTENIYSLKKLLTSKEFEVDTALSGEEALKKVLKNDYVLIILDVQMPGMDGFEVAETLSGFNKTKNIPIIFLSAVSTNKQFITRGYASGGIDYVTKPIDPDILLLKVNTFVRLYEQTKALHEIQEALRTEIEIRKKVQSELKDRVEQLHSTLESLPLIAFTADPSGKIEFVNQHWYQYSSSLKEFPMTHPDDGDIDKEFKNAILLGEKMVMEVRISKLHHQDYCYHLLKITPIKDQEKIIKWVGTFTDIDVQKQIEKKKDEFLSIASHELKTPLTSIKAYIQLLSRNLKDHESEQLKSYIEKAELQVGKLNQLISELLDISKIESGELKLNKKHFNLQELLEGAAETIRQTHEGCEIIIYNNEMPLEVFADESRLEQVLLNYMTNALKYSPENKLITITREDNEHDFTVKVKDNGIGISPEKQKSVFTKFYRVEESSLKFQGLGIGLYICAEIINRHQGKYGVVSDFNKGSEFYFSIPRIAQDI